ncbi:MAG TPA: RNA-binding S4 domain-containing protein [Stellaceae bacterium]|jgi:ribosome-associated heat shock protein Hsp15
MSIESMSVATLRLDKWLWFARLARTRSLAARLCAEGRVAVGNRDGAKPHQAVKLGDVVVVELPHQRRRLIVRGLGERRGPPAEARSLYDEPSPPSPREAAAEWVSLFADDDLAFET